MAIATADHPRDKMFSAVILQFKVIGVVQACGPRNRRSFSEHDLKLLDMLTLVVAKMIEVTQLLKIIESRFAWNALMPPRKISVGQIVAESVQDPGRVARMLAKSFYQE
jgi:L-methionine (R)-S-oxide reductase